MVKVESWNFMTGLYVPYCPTTTTTLLVFVSLETPKRQWFSLSEDSPFILTLRNVDQEEIMEVESDISAL